jgi:DNA-binding transcriptional MerR regulator
LAKKTGETNATLRFWTKEGLLEVAEVTESGGYQLYDPEMVSRVQKIRQLQAERFSLREIKAKLTAT